MASQQDVAKLANVSYMTVSRVVNGSENVSPATRERVQAAIKELSYYPNAAARILNKKQTNSIGIILPKQEYLLSAPFYMELLLAIEKNLKAKGYNLFLGSVGSREKEKDYSIMYKEGKVDGLIVFAPSKEDPSIKKLVSDDIPFVLVLGRNENLPCNYVDVDNLKSSVAIIEYLLSLNHKKIGFVTGNLAEFNAEERLIGYKKALSKANIPYQENMVHYGDWSLNSGYEAFSFFLKLNDKPTAIFCSNDHMAMGVIKAAQDNNVSIPENLSVVGFDDIQYSSFITPSLTTVRQPFVEIALKATEIIIDRVKNRNKEPVNITLKPEFIVRNSCKKNEQL